MNSNSPSKASSKRRSLRAALRGILSKGRAETSDVADTVGSGILRLDPSCCTLPTPRQVPSIASFVDRFDIENETYIPDRFGSSIPDLLDVSSLASAVSMGHSLQPQMSMSSFRNAHSPIMRYHDQHPDVQRQTTGIRPQTEWVSKVYGDGFSHHGSVSEFSRTASTLRIQTSVQSFRQEPHPLPPLPPVPSLLTRPEPKRPGLTRKQSSIAEVQQSNLVDPSSPKTRSANSSVRFADLPTLSRTPSLRSDSTTDHQINHFASFCILDTSRVECPVSATSKDLRYIFDIGEEFCLNNHGCEGTSMDMVNGWDAQGNPVIHLVLFSPLIIPSSGRSRFMLASLVDVTEFLNDAASLPELETISEESFEDDLPTPTFKPRLHSSLNSPKSNQYMLSAEDLLGGCFVAEPKSPITMNDNYDDDIWLNLASEEKLRSSGSRTPSNHPSVTSSIEEVLDEFMGNLQELYSDFFLLAKSPFDDNYYEICNVSPRVYASKDYVHGHLSRTSTNDMIELSTRLAYDEPFTMLVRWGNQGLMRQMYCIPLFARISTTWVCFLVDPSMPLMW